MDVAPLDLIRTTQEQRETIDFLEKMLSENFKSKPDSKKLIKSTFTQNLNSSIWSQISKQGVQASREAIEKYLNQLLSSTRELNELKITLASPLSEKSLQSLGNWLKKNSPNSIFDITFDPKILGGAIIISQKGEYKDYSLLKKIDDYFENQQLTS